MTVLIGKVKLPVRAFLDTVRRFIYISFERLAIALFIMFLGGHK
jgi:hypothetical protein